MKKSSVLTTIKNGFSSVLSFLGKILRSIGSFIKYIFELLLKIPKQIFLFIRESIRLILFSILTFSVFMLTLSLSTFLMVQAFGLSDSEVFIQHRDRILNIMVLESDEELTEWEQEVLEDNNLSR